MQAILLALVVMGAGIQEPKTKLTAFEIEHTTRGERITLRHGCPGRREDYARTVRLSVLRDEFGRCHEVRLARQESFAIDLDRPRRIFRTPAERHWAIESFARDTGLVEETLEFDEGNTVRRIALSKLLDDRRLCEPLEKRILKWGTVDELIVERK